MPLSGGAPPSLGTLVGARLHAHDKTLASMMTRRANNPRSLSQVICAQDRMSNSLLLLEGSCMRTCILVSALSLSCSGSLFGGANDGSASGDGPASVIDDSGPAREDGPGDFGIAPCAAMPTFQHDVMGGPLSGCGGENCHQQPLNQAGGLDLRPAQAYASLVNVAATIASAKVRVKPGDPDHSFLWQKLTDQLDTSEGSAMPRPPATGGNWTELPEDKLAILRCWIAGGAPNN
jgi:hypothetical protein